MMGLSSGLEFSKVDSKEGVCGSSAGAEKETLG